MMRGRRIEPERLVQRQVAHVIRDHRARPRLRRILSARLGYSLRVRMARGIYSNGNGTRQNNDGETSDGSN
jgi:hypothetical protein